MDETPEGRGEKPTKIEVADIAHGAIFSNGGDTSFIEVGEGRSLGFGKGFLDDFADITPLLNGY